MSIIANNLLQGDEGYNLTRSLRFRSSASANLSKTWGSNGSSQTFTISAWVKRGSLGSIQDIVTARQNGLNNLSFRFTASDTLEVYAFSGGSLVMNLITTQVFRDPSAWYHVIFAVDTTQATSTNRVKFYVNGAQITAFSTATYPSLSATTLWNQTAATHYFATYDGSSELFDGYKAEINVIDGQTLTPSSFGETDLITGVWKPKKYAGTYGTNGFYLPFTDNASTTTLGNDFSGNSNNWTTNNISLTAGTTYDSMIDVPTVSALASNYCVMNPLNKNSNHTITDGNLTITSSSYGGAAATFGISTGKWYHESTITNRTSNNSGAIGYCNENYKIATELYFPNTTDAFGVNAIDGAAASGTSTSYGSAFSSGDVIMLAFDADAKKMWVGKNGTWFASGDPVAGTNYYPKTITGNTFFPAVNCFGDTYAYNFGQRPFAYTPPTGFVALNTFNLPEPSIKAGNKQMDVTTYTGTGASLSVVNAGGFQPDFVWTKTRSNAFGHTLFDSIRGVTNYLQSNNANAEGTTATTLTAFNSNGFTVGSDSSTGQNGATYVGWQWKAGGAAVTNTAGTITSQVSANTTSGFSVVTWVDSASAYTVGHGLEIAPAFIILKDRSNAYNWDVGCNSIGWNNRLKLNDTSATSAGYWNNTAPTSSVFSYVGNGTGNMVAYCFSEVAGYSKFGSYTGNGSTDGTFVHTGFRPRFVIIKHTNQAGNNWRMVDSSRLGYNPDNYPLFPSLSDAESATVVCDMVSNGFKFRSTAQGVNGSSDSYIYAAFAENPFKYSLAR